MLDSFTQATALLLVIPMPILIVLSAISYARYLSHYRRKHWNN